MNDLKVYPYFTNDSFIIIFTIQFTFKILTLHRELSVPFPSAREAEVVYQVLRVDEEPPRSEATKNLTLNNNILEVSFSGKEARKVRVALTSFFDNLLLVTETIEKFGPPEPTYSHYEANN
ncbi:L antigen family member 3 [Trachymyrmex cornetzi]|uniref:L antigen family member 3 n=1 Tax=Trachymyrmex cornetzi TaxID=471704 RepID=A0A195EHR2_9HYME|nr:L antigen family member 3 [Trachymyrmex cornetzi]